MALFFFLFNIAEKMFINDYTANCFLKIEESRLLADDLRQPQLFIQELFCSLFIPHWTVYKDLYHMLSALRKLRREGIST